jgi:4-diphosphocytidyl-2-C-methyl-D-erythritol kinase
MSGCEPVAAWAPAKINLWLDVLGRRDDGYHDIRTWMLAVDLWDRVEARAVDREGIRIEVRGAAAPAGVPTGRANLAWRGAEEVLNEAARRGLIAADVGLDLVLEKAIPTQAGLGGGSSDAAAAWIASEAALGLDLGLEAARIRLGGLGSDCVFFLEASATGSALCEGRGERVRPVPGPGDGWWIALVSPEVVCPTAQVYAALRRTSGEARESRPDLPRDWHLLPAREVLACTYNRLEAAALEAVPKLRPWRDLLEAETNGPWLVSGSGSSFYTLCDAREEADAAIERVRSAGRVAGLPLRGAWVLRPAGFGAKKT